MGVLDLCPSHEHDAGTGTVTVASAEASSNQHQAPTAALNKIEEPMADQHVNAMQSLFFNPPSPSVPAVALLPGASGACCAIFRLVTNPPQASRRRG